MKGASGRLLFSGLLEAAAWVCLTGAFLYCYVARFSVPPDSIWPHTRFVLLLVLAVSLARLGMSWLIPARAWSRAAGALFLASVLALLASYYVLVVIGLQSWGRVVSWELMASYASQLEHLLATLGVPAVVPIAMAGAVLTWIAAIWVLLGRLDWTYQAVLVLDPRVLRVIFAGCAGILVAGVYQFLAFPPIAQHEPVSLTLFPVPAARDLQGHAIDQLRSQRLDQEEDKARALYEPAPGPHTTNVILIVVDALRPDHMGIYGYARDTTPNLSRIAQMGIVRKAMVTHASCGSSACGLLSLASSKYLHQFSDRPFTLQEALKRHGYRIHMMLGGDHTSYYSLRKTYGRVDSYFDGYTGRHFGTYFNDDKLLLDHLDGFPPADGVPVMIQFHLMSAHLLGKRHPESMKYLPAASYAFAEGRDADAKGNPGPRNVNFYDNGVLQTDAMIHQLLERLQRKGYLSRALVVVTADHGEGLGEHGIFQHASGVYEQTLRVPLVLATFGYKAGRAAARRPYLSQVDIAPTILAELGMPQPMTWAGVPMQQVDTRPFSFFQERTRVGVIDYRSPPAVWKYWVDSATGREFAFDLNVDPAESRNVAGAMAPEILRVWRAQVLPGLSVQVLPETRAAGP